MKRSIFTVLVVGLTLASSPAAWGEEINWGSMGDPSHEDMDRCYQTHPKTQGKLGSGRGAWDKMCIKIGDEAFFQCFKRGSKVCKARKGRSHRKCNIRLTDLCSEQSYGIRGAYGTCIGDTLDVVVRDCLQARDPSPQSSESYQDPFVSHTSTPAKDSAPSPTYGQCDSIAHRYIACIQNESCLLRGDFIDIATQYQHCWNTQMNSIIEAQ